MTSSIVIGTFTKIYHATHTFHLPEFLKEDYSKYYLLQWRGKYLQEQLAQSRITHQEVKYSPVYHHSMPIEEIDPMAQYQVSFRLLKGYSEGIALIRKKKGF